MLYSLILNLIETYSFLNVFKYLTVRTGLSVFTSLLVVFLIDLRSYRLIHVFVGDMKALLLSYFQQGLAVGIILLSVQTAHIVQ